MLIPLRDRTGEGTGRYSRSKVHQETNKETQQLQASGAVHTCAEEGNRLSMSCACDGCLIGCSLGGIWIICIWYMVYV